MRVYNKTDIYVENGDEKWLVKKERTREVFEAILEKINQKDEMNFQKGLAQTGGRANIGKFINGLLFYNDAVKR